MSIKVTSLSKAYIGGANPLNKLSDGRKTLHVKVRLPGKSVSVDSLKLSRNTDLVRISGNDNGRMSGYLPQARNSLISMRAPDDFIEPTHNLIIPSTFEYVSSSKHMTKNSICAIVDKPHLRRRNTTGNRKVQDNSKRICGYIKKLV